MKPLPDPAELVRLWHVDRERYQAELDAYRKAGLDDRHPLPARAIRRIGIINRVLAAIDKRDETETHDG